MRRADEKNDQSYFLIFRKVKRVEDVIRVFAETIKKVYLQNSYLFGDGPERYGCEQLCRELSLCEHI